MKALLLHHPYTYPRFEQDFVDRVEELPEFEVARADLDALDAGQLVASDRTIIPSHYDAIIVFVAFKRLRAASTLSWGDFKGLRLMMDHDIVQNYSDIFDPSLKGAWPPVIRRHRFDVVLTSGAVVRDRLIDEGLAADWVPKAFEPQRFRAETQARARIVTYGSPYLCRQIAERALTEARLPVTRLPMTPYLSLGAALNQFLGCMAISSDLDTPVEGRSALQDTPAQAVAMRPGLEPMAKFFEGAAAGCCPIADAMADLHVLGFRDGETALTFQTHAELVGKLQAALETPDILRSIGRAAAKLAHEAHTWTHRAQMLRDAVQRRL